uniref:Uncharacterized protein n=1 Tax=Rhizophora mucronata TaxID=61149 RepID=A0A2P2QMX2_RHIMU
MMNTKISKYGTEVYHSTRIQKEQVLNSHRVLSPRKEQVLVHRQGPNTTKTSNYKLVKL